MGRATLLLVIAVFIGQLILTNGYTSFVQQRMRIPLILAAVMLLAFGLIEAFLGYREEAEDPEAPNRSISPTIGWLLAAPILVLAAVAPTTLGAAAAQRADPLTPTEIDPLSSELDPIDDSNGPVEMRVYDFLSRALWDENESLRDQQVVLEGIVVDDDEIDDGFLLTRFAVSCCAADGLPLQVRLRGVNGIFADDTWVRATVVWRPPPDDSSETDDLPNVVEADVVAIEIIDDPPDDPYENPY